MLSIIAMVTGFAVSFYGVYYYNQGLTYLGLVVVTVTCVAWWAWVMTVIKAVWDSTNSTVNDVSDIRQGIKEVKRLLEEYRNLSNR
jgi:hypothetical protein